MEHQDSLAPICDLGRHFLNLGLSIRDRTLDRRRIEFFGHSHVGGLVMPPLPGGLFPREPMLEFDTTDNKFRDELLLEPLDIQGQVESNGGFAAVPTGPGLGVEPDLAFIAKYETAL